MIAVVDYGTGNLFSIMQALRYLDLPAEVTADPDTLRGAEGLILPGVGAFPDAMAKLSTSGLKDILLVEAKKKPLLGICLGMQLLFQESTEHHPTPGLGLIPGCVRRLDTKGEKSTHVGWNQLNWRSQCALNVGLSHGAYVYYVHSFCVETDAPWIMGTTTYGETFPGMVCYGQIYGTQFHPEKSGTVGLAILRQFGRLVST